MTVLNRSLRHGSPVTAILLILAIPVAVVVFLVWGGKHPWWPKDGGP